MMPLDAGESITFVDPRPVPGGTATQSADTVPADGWFSPTTYRGAFDTDLWISGWSYLDATERLPANRAVTADSVKGGKIMAQGAKGNPITFRSALDDSKLTYDDADRQ